MFHHPPEDAPRLVEVVAGIEHQLDPQPVPAPLLDAAVAVNNTTTVAGTHAPSTSDAGTQENADAEVSSTAPGGTVPRRDGTPISVFVSRKLSKLFVRRGFTPLFDGPVKIQNPEQPLGTDVFTAMELKREHINSLDRSVATGAILFSVQGFHQPAESTRANNNCGCRARAVGRRQHCA